MLAPPPPSPSHTTTAADDQPSLSHNITHTTVPTPFAADDSGRLHTILARRSYISNGAAGGSLIASGSIGDRIGAKRALIYFCALTGVTGALRMAA